MPNFRYSRRLAAALLAVLAASPAAAQVSVAPTGLFLTEQERFGAIYVSNSSNTAQEVTIDFRFGYPATDSLGNVSMMYDDSATAKRASISQYLRAFPQKFILPPGETQVIRLTAQPPANLAEGMYWTRVVTSAIPQAQFSADTTTAGIQARLQFRLQQVTALFYRKGTPTVQVGLSDASAHADSLNVSISTKVAHTGNSPFFGMAQIRVLDANRRVVHEEKQAVAFYISEQRNFVTKLTKPAAPGSYTVELVLTSDRTDLPQPQQTRIAPITIQAPLTIRNGLQ